MKSIFINREKELAKLKEMKNKRFFLVVSGRRRIGKTALLKKAFPGAYYLFIWPNKSINMPLKDFIEIWSIFEGIPYYYELIDKNKDSIGNIRELLINKNSTLQDEGNAVLSIEFGAQSKTYNTILTAISEGKTKLNEIASVFEDKTNIVIKYLETLRKEFSLVRRITPILDDTKKSKLGRYGINDNFLNFWFYYIEKNRNYIEQDRFDELNSFFMSNFNSYVGKTFEKFIISLIKDNLIDEFAKFEFSKVGGQWGNFRGENGKQVYEIDICAVNEKTKEILFGECKWQEKVNSLSVLNELKDKINYVRWENEKRKESYAVFARSFSKKVGEFEGRKVYCFDLKDIEKRLK